MDYMKDFESHLDKIVDPVLNEGSMEATSTEKKLANYGRILMDQAVTQKDDALSNVMSRVGDELTRYGTTFGASSLEELVKRTKTSPNVIKKLLAYAEKIAQTQTAISSDHSDGGLDDEGDSEFTQASDDEMAAMADRAARERR